MRRAGGSWAWSGRALGTLLVLLTPGAGKGDGARLAFSRPIPGLSDAERLDFQLGRALFERPWVGAPASTDSADGLGPLYNARSCSGCHPRNGRGLAPDQDGRAPVALVLRLSVPPPGGKRTPQGEGHPQSSWPDPPPEPTYGAQLQPLALPGHLTEGWVGVRYSETEVRLADGERVRLRVPTYQPQDLGYGPMDLATQTSPRLAPQLIGLGLLEAIPESAILALSDPADTDGDGISGRPNRVWDQARGRVVLGRFGWKASEASVDAQVQSAFARDLGIATERHPLGAGDCTDRQPQCLAAPQGNSPRHAGVEAGPQITTLVAHTTRSLAVPARRDPQALAVQDGEATFQRIGCSACHSPELPAAPPAEGSQDRIRPYTDLLLHDMGTGLADGRPEGDAAGQEWRTPPLWGIGLVPEVSGQAAYLHDGRARSLLEAILWHDGEARQSREAVIDLSSSSRANLLHFLESL